MEDDTRIAAIVILCLLCSVFAIGSGTATSCSPQPAVGMDTTGEGEWWVLVAKQQYGDTATVYHLSNRGTASQSQTLDIPTNGSEEPAVGIEQGADGQWYVLTTDRVHVFDSNWQALNRSIPLPTSSRSLFGDGGITQDANGQWWIAYDDVLYRYSASWERTATLTVSATGVSAFGEDVRVLQDKTVSRVTNPRGDPSLEPAWSMDRELSDPVAITRTGGMWKILDDGGSVHRYTPYGQFTGDSERLPIDAYDCRLTLSFAFAVYFFSPVVIAVWLLLPMAVTVFYYPERWAAILGSSVFGIGGAVSMYFYALPWPFSVIYWLPDPLIGTLLFLTAAGLASRFIGNWKLFLLSTLLLLPVVIVSVLIWPLLLIIGVVIVLITPLFMIRRQRQPQSAR